jgi:hypothetical protein
LANGKTSTEKYADEQVAFGKKLGKTVSDLGSSLYKGEKGVTQFGNAVESVATALASLAAIAATVNPALRVLAMLATGLAGFPKESMPLPNKAMHFIKAIKI